MWSNSYENHKPEEKIPIRESKIYIYLKMFQPSWNKNFSVVSVLGPIITHFLSAFTRVYIRFFPGWIQCTSPMMMHNEFSSLGLTDKTGIFLGVAKTSHHNSPLLKETRSWGEFNFAKTSGSITREQEKANSWPARPHVRSEGFFSRSSCSPLNFQRKQ